MSSGLMLRSLVQATADGTHLSAITPNPAGLSFVVGTPEQTRPLLSLMRAILDPATPQTLGELLGDLPVPPRIKLDLSSPAGQRTMVILEGGKRFVLEGAEGITNYAGKPEFLDELEKRLDMGRLRIPFISHSQPLVLDGPTLALFGSMSAAQRWRLLQDSESRRAVFLQRREDLEARADALREELSQLEQSADGTGEGAEKLRERIRQTEAELAELSESLARIESTWSRWQEHQRLSQHLADLRRALEQGGTDRARLQALEAELGDRFDHITAIETLPMDLHILEVNRNDLRQQQERLNRNRDDARRVREQLEALQARMKDAYDQYQGVTSDFPVFLHLYKTCESYRRAAEDEVQVLNQQLDENNKELRSFTQFDQVPADFQAQVGALAALEKDAAVQMDLLARKLDSVEELKAQRQELAAQIVPEYETYPADWPERLKRLRALKDELERVQSQAAELEERKSLLVETRPSFLELTDTWPADFPEQLKAWRLREAQRIKDDAREAEIADLQGLQGQMTLELAACEGLEEQHALPRRLQELLRARQELASESEAWRDMQARLADINEAVVRGQEAFGDMSSDYPNQIEALRELLARAGTVRDQLQAARHRQGEKLDLESRLNAYPDLLKVPDTFPDHMREYVRLKRVATELSTGVAAIDKRLASLRASLSDKYAHVHEAAGDESQAYRNEDETMHGILAHLESQLDGRRRLESRLEEARAALKELAEVESWNEETHQSLRASRQLALAGAPPDVLQTVQRHLEETLKVPPDAGERFARWERARLDAVRLEAALSEMAPMERLTALRDSLLRLVSARLEKSGLELVVEDYLSYQAARALVERLEAEKEKLVNRSGSGNDLARIQDKLQQLEGLCGVEVLEQPLEPTVARFQEVAYLREQLQAVLQDCPDPGPLEQQLQALDEQIRKEMGRLHLKNAEELAAAVNRFQEYQAAIVSQNALQEAMKARWPSTVAPDGSMRSDLDRRRDELAELESNLGPFAATLKGEEDVVHLTERWNHARQLRAELNGVETELARLTAVPASEPPAVMLSGVDAEDDLLLWVWEQRQRFDQAIGQLASEGSSLAAEAEARLVKDVERLEAETPGLAGDDSPLEERLEKFMRDRKARLALAGLDARIESLGTPESVQAAREALQERLAQQRAALHLAPETDLESVLAEYARFQEVSQKRRILLQLLAQQDRTVADLVEKLDDLRPKLNGCESNPDLDAELARWQTYQAETEQVKTMETEVARLEEEEKTLTASIADVEQLVTDTEGRLGRWTRELDIDQVRQAFDTFLKHRDEVKTLRERLATTPQGEALETGIRETESQLAELGDQMAPPSGLLQQREDLRRTQAETQKRLQELESSLKRLESAGAPEPSGPSEETSRLIEQHRQTLSNLEGEMTAVDAALEKINGRLDLPPMERCRDRASELLSRFTRGRYIQMSGEGQRVWLWPARGGKIPLDESASVQGCATLCWRLAVLHELGHDYPWPIILDHPFADVDASSRFQVLEVLADLARDRQVTVLTTPNSVVSPHLIVAKMDAALSAAGDA